MIPGSRARLSERPLRPGPGEGPLDRPSGADSVAPLLASWLGILLPFVVIEPAPVDILLVLTLVWGVLSSRPLLPRPAMLALVAFMVSTVFAVGSAFGTSAIPGDAVRYLVIETLFIAALLGLWMLVSWSDESVRALARGYTIGAVGASVLVLILYIGPSPEWIFRDDSGTRVRGTFKDPNVLGPFLVFPVLYVAWVWRRPLLTRAAAVAPVLACLLLTLSRGAYLALFVAIAALLAFTLRWRLVPAAAVVALGVLAIVSVVDIDLQADSVAARRLRPQDYDDQRFGNLAIAWDTLLREPLGIGPAQFGATHGSNPHNLFLGKATDAGVLAATILVGALIASVVVATRAAIRSSDRLLLVTTAALLGNLASSVFVYSHHWRHLLVLSVLAVAQVRHRTRTDGVSPDPRTLRDLASRRGRNG